MYWMWEHTDTTEPELVLLFDTELLNREDFFLGGSQSYGEFSIPDTVDLATAC